MSFNACSHSTSGLRSPAFARSMIFLAMACLSHRPRWRRDAVKPVSFSPLRNADKKGGALTRLLVVATGEVFTANLREQERPGQSDLPERH